MKIGIYDGDIYQPNTKPFPNLEAMKVSSFYKSKGYMVELINYPTLDILDKYDKIIIRKDRNKGKIDKKLLVNPKVEHGGLFFTNHIYIPMEDEIEKMKPDTTLYFPFLRFKLEQGKMTEKEIEHFMSGVYVRLFYDKWTVKPTINHGQSVIIYDLDITSHDNWAETVAEIYETSGRKTKILHPVIARSMEDLIYLCEEKPFYSDRPTKIIIDLPEVENDFKSFLMQNKTLLQKYGGQMLFIYINKNSSQKIVYKDYIIDMMNKIFFARSEEVKLNLLFIQSNFYNPYDKIMSTLADFFYMQPNISFYQKFTKGSSEPTLRAIFDEIAYDKNNNNIFFVNLELIKQGGTWDYDQIRIRTRD